MPFPLASVLDIGSKIIDRLIPDKEKAAEMKLELIKLEQSGDLAVMTAQAEINKIEAASQSVFVSGWRPFCGWVAGMGMAVAFVIGPIVEWIGAMTGNPVPFPKLDTMSLINLLLGMLGLSGMRTYERINGVIPPGKG